MFIDLLNLFISLAIYVFLSPGELYTSEKHGSDETGDGTADRPLKTAMQAMRKAGKEPFPTIYVDAKEEGQVGICVY